jgi:TPR repeat protein
MSAPRARDFYRQACNSAVGRGCSNWGHLFQAGSADLVRAAILYRLGCLLGDASGCLDIGGLPGLRGRSFAARARVVRTELDGGCAKGSAESCRLAGVLLQSGIGIAAEPVAARGRFQDGCRLLDQVSCDALETIDEAQDAAR